MRLYANDVRSRIAISRLLTKIEKQPEYSRKIGVENASHFRTEAGSEEKEVEKNVESSGAYFYCGRAF